MRALFIRTSLLLATVVSTATAQRDTAFAWSKRMPDGARLSIVNLSGPIDVRASNGDRVEVHTSVRAESRGGNVSDVTFDVRERSGEDVQICTVYQNKSACDRDQSWKDIRVTVRYTIDLPKAMRLKVTTGNGDLTIAQTVSEIDATTGNGDIDVKESTGRVTATSGNGSLTVTSARGPVNVSTGNGKIIANSSRGPVEASTGNGDIDVRMASIPPDQVSMTFRTGMGHVRVFLPSDFNGELNASTGNGSISTDFDVRVQGRMSSNRLRGTIGTGRGPIIKLTTGNGRLEVRKN